MPYNHQQQPYLTTAGKVTIFTTFTGVLAFFFIFLFNIGQSEFMQATAATSSVATTSVNVLNTPPEWTVDAEEEFESSTAFPTNSGRQVSWIATGTDSNNAPYFLLICSTSASPTAVANSGTPGTAPPICAGGNANRWAVSPAASSGVQARAATTTTQSFAESNVWYAWICDDDAVNPRCNNAFRQGSGTTSSPFNVNRRPVFNAFADNSPANPGATVTFFSTSTDPDTDGGQDQIRLIVCNSSSFSTTTDTCGGTTIATSALMYPDAFATYQLPAVIQDQNYPAFGFLVDEHGHEAQGGAHGTDAVLTVNNVAPTVDGSQISLNNGNNIILTTAAGQTTGFRLSFVVNDANSCVNAASNPEIRGYVASVFRSGVGSSSCQAGPDYDPNDCYPSAVGTSTWNLSCAATTTPSDCTGATDSSQTWECTFPLWYVADPTDGGSGNSFYFAEDWRAAVSGVDDNNATGTFTQSTTANIDLQGLLAFNLNTLAIPYGDLAPGDNTGTLRATTTASSTGNVGIDTNLSGVRMCPNSLGFPIGTCPITSTSSIAASQQEYATSSLPYGSGTDLSTSTALLDLNVPKPTATSTQPGRNAFWGIEIPASISLAGVYTGQNTFQAVLSDPAQW